MPNGHGFTTTAGAVPTVSTSDWYHFAVTFAGNNSEGSDAKFYWTKVEPSATEANLVMTPNTTITTTNDLKFFHIGNWNGNDFEGLVDEFRISNVVRAANEFIFGGATGYPAWADTNVNNDQPHVDTNNDGVINGVAYFMDQTGLITLLGVVTAMNGTKTVTWPMQAKSPTPSIMPAVANGSSFKPPSTSRIGFLLIFLSAISPTIPVSSAIPLWSPPPFSSASR